MTDPTDATHPENRPSQPGSRAEQASELPVSAAPFASLRAADPTSAVNSAETYRGWSDGVLAAPQCQPGDDRVPFPSYDEGPEPRFYGPVTLQRVHELHFGSRLVITWQELGKTWFALAVITGATDDGGFAGQFLPMSPEQTDRISEWLTQEGRR